MDFLLRNLVIFAIAPCVGAWIEVKTGKWLNDRKHDRTLRGCVD